MGIRLFSNSVNPQHHVNLYIPLEASVIPKSHGDFSMIINGVREDLYVLTHDIQCASQIAELLYREIGTKEWQKHKEWCNRNSFI